MCAVVLLVIAIISMIFNGGFLLKMRNLREKKNELIEESSPTMVM